MAAQQSLFCPTTSWNKIKQLLDMLNAKTKTVKQERFNHKMARTTFVIMCEKKLQLQVNKWAATSREAIHQIHKTAQKPLAGHS